MALKDLKSYIPKEVEGEVLEFWKKKEIFKKSLKKKSSKGDYVFYDGPPFATGTPHYGHILASTIKDVIPRYKTMKGHYVERKWGWDCHGLPIENIAEKALGIKRKKEIEKMGIDKFNEFCRSKVLDYVDDWEKIIDKLGRWADMENAYKTMDASYMESVWWVFKELWDKGLIYEGYRSMHVCPRCETTLSQQEVSEGYKDIKDLSATVKFKIKNFKEIFGITDDVYLLAWTTTPWTLLGNVALAVGKKEKGITYKLIFIEPDIGTIGLNSNGNHGNYKESQSHFAEKTDKFIKEHKGKAYLVTSTYDVTKTFNFPVKENLLLKDITEEKLVQLKYEPLLEYPATKNIQNKENGWKIYAGDFVTTEEGTGIVHIAPAFGEDDLQLGNKYKLPFIQHIGMDGIIKPGFGEFSGTSISPRAKDNPNEIREIDLSIIKFLGDKIFNSSKYNHSYPDCWRCDTPLINYATSSWFVNILKIKGKALELAKKINWIPAHIKEGRFGNWLEGARDWSISRQRFWASAMPIWKCGKCDNIKVIGSINDIKKNIKKSGNNYFVMRHGEADSNLKDIVSCNPNNTHHLTKKGEAQVKKSTQELIEKIKNNKIDFIFSSDFARTKETAELAGKLLGVPKVIYDKRLREMNAGIFDGKTWKDYYNFFSSDIEKFHKAPEKGETYTQIQQRGGEFLYEIDKKHSNKNILIIGHECPIWFMLSASKGFNPQEALNFRGTKEIFFKNGVIKEFEFTPLPHNENYILDLHRPYIDEVKFSCDCGGEYKRITDVLDTWFDSGSMPYAQAHYPFENKKKFDNNFPAEFIGEGVDQTRAWFYYLHSISTAIKNSNAYKNVVVNGIVLAEDGKKMSKKLQNYPDPAVVLDKYGADALRLYMISSPVVKAESLNFSEKGVDEIYKKTILRLWNSFLFYKTYADNKIISVKRLTPSKNVLDNWILARLQETINQISEAMEKYELEKATRPIGEFVEDLSTWYIRRSRDRFKENDADQKSAIATTDFVLSEFSKAIAPITPFISEALFKLLRSKKISVHLEDYPSVKKLTAKEKLLIEEMKEIRKFAELALAKRQEAGIKVRQPLQKLKVKSEKLKGKKELLMILADEINVKEIIVSARGGSAIGGDNKINGEVELDLEITQELKDEGQIRELVRMIQDLRKQAGYQPSDIIILNIECENETQELIQKYSKELIKAVGAKSIEFKRVEKFGAEIESKIDGKPVWLGIQKK